MSDDYNSYSRVNRFDKRRKNTKAISLMAILGGLLVIVLIGIFIFGNNDDSKAVDDDNDEETNENQEENDQLSSNSEPETEQSNEDGTNEETDEGTNEEATSDNENENSNPVSNSNNVETETVASDDENVIEAYTGNWGAVETSQEAPYQIPWSEWEEEGTEDSQEWHELLQAIRLVTRLNEDDMITWWTTSKNGPNNVVATVTNKDQTENYRAYVSLDDNEGWVPTRVEILKENDQKYRFTDDSTSNDETTEESSAEDDDTVTEEPAE